MLAVVEDRFLDDCRRELIKIHKALIQELTDAQGDEQYQSALLIEFRACKEALKRIDAGQFGRCQQCDEAIELNRLKAEPTQCVCLYCQSHH